MRLLLVRCTAMLLPVALLVTLAGTVHGASCDAIPDLDARLACYDRLTDCAAITDDQARLACFERRSAPESNVSSTQQEAPDGADSVNAVPPPAAPEPATDTGPFAVKGRSRPEPDDAAEPKLTASITRVREDPRGIVYLYLDNGQVWRETSRSRFNYRPGMAVEITSGVLGSTNLVAEGMRSYAKVRRVK